MIDKDKRYRTPSGEIVTGAELVEVPRTAEDVVLWAIQDFARKSPRNSCTQHQCIVTALREAGYDLDNPKAQPDPEGWIEHDGGPCPVGGDVRVDIKVGSVSAYGMFAEFLEWNHVTHYRVVGS